MGTIVKLTSDEKRKQYRLTIPKSIVEVLEFEPNDEFQLIWDKEKKYLILRKVE